MKVYHGSSNKNLKFNPKKPLMFFTTSKEDARGWAERLILGGKKNTGNYIYTAELNFKKLYERGDDFNPEYAEYENHEAKDEIWDEIFFEDIEEKRDELVKAGFDCFHIELGDGLEYYIVPYECRNIIKWINKEILSEDLNKKKKKMGDCFITKSPYDIVNLFKNKPKEYRVLYDKNIDMYMIGDAESVTHYDMVQKAYKDAYYYNMENFIQDLGGTIDNYTEMGQSGYWDGEDDENFDAYLWYIVFSPNEEWELGTDGYNKRYDYPFGHVFTRGCDLSEIGLWDALGVPQNSEKINESADNLNDAFWKWFGNSKVVDSQGNPLVVYHGTDKNFETFKLTKHKHDAGYYGAGFYFANTPSEASYYGNNIMPCYLKIEKPFTIENNSTLAEDKAITEATALINLGFLQDKDIINSVELWKKYKYLLDYVEYKKDEQEWIAFFTNIDSLNLSERDKDWLKYERPFGCGYSKENAEYDIWSQIKEHFKIKLNFSLADYIRNNSYEFTKFLKKNGYDGVIIGDEYVAFESNQIKAIDNKGTWSTSSDNIYESLNKELERYL